MHLAVMQVRILLTYVALSTLCMDIMVLALWWHHWTQLNLVSAPQGVLHDTIL